MRTLAAALGDPQTTFPSVLIAGTNGKGSTAATLASILTAAGYRTGLYTSPHLVRVNERIQISAIEPPSAGPSASPSPTTTSPASTSTSTTPPAPSSTPATSRTRPASSRSSPPSPSCYFAEQKVDIAVLEVGLGGRLDATNIVDPILSVITDIALDHQDYLGNTIAEITREKAGILRPNGTLITLPQHPEANQAIGEAAATLNLRAISAADFIPPTLHGTAASRLFTRATRTSRRTSPATTTPSPSTAQPLDVDSPLPGQHQQRNIALAIATAVELRNLNRYKSSRQI